MATGGASGATCWAPTSSTTCAIRGMSMAEYFCDIDQIPGDGSWRAEDHPAEDALYRWGPKLPPEFERNFEPE